MEWQTVIIGSGVAAAAVASKLLDRDPGHALLLLEAGPRVPSKDRRLWWDFVLSGRSAYDHCHDLPLPGDGNTETENESTGSTPWTFRESRMMGVGGSTYHWGGWALRFKDEDSSSSRAPAAGPTGRFRTTTSSPITAKPRPCWESRAKTRTAGTAARGNIPCQPSNRRPPMGQ